MNTGPCLTKWRLYFILRVMHPYQFEQLSIFWREKLVSYYYNDIESQDPSFTVLSRLLNLEPLEDDIQNANGSLKTYYYLKTNQLERASQLVQQDKQHLLNILRYFEFMSKTENKRGHCLARLIGR